MQKQMEISVSTLSKFCEEEVSHIFRHRIIESSNRIVCVFPDGSALAACGHTPQSFLQKLPSLTRLTIQEPVFHERVFPGPLSPTFFRSLCIVDLLPKLR